MSLACNSFAIVLLVCVAIQGYGQRRDTTQRIDYHVNYKITVPVLVAGAVTNSIGLARIRDKKFLTEADLMRLNKNDVAWIDRIAVNQHSDRYVRYEKNSDFALTWGTLTPALLIGLDKRMRKDWLDISMVYLEAQIITSNFYAYSFMGPTFIERYRPVVYFEDVPLEERLWGGNRNSFYSGHVSVTAVTTFFMAQSYLDYHPEHRNLRWPLYAVATFPPVLIAYKRVQALKHFPSDVAVGLLVGIAGGTLIPKLHHGKKGQSLSMGVIYEPDLKAVSCALRF
jgi:membrane-associated phospholipid phosphatase